MSNMDLGKIHAMTTQQMLDVVYGLVVRGTTFTVEKFKPHNPKNYKGEWIITLTGGY